MPPRDACNLPALYHTRTAEPKKKFVFNSCLLFCWKISFSLESFNPGRKSRIFGQSLGILGNNNGRVVVGSYLRSKFHHSTTPLGPTIADGLFRLRGLGEIADAGLSLQKSQELLVLNVLIFSKPRCAFAASKATHIAILICHFEMQRLAICQGRILAVWILATKKSTKNPL